MRDEMNDDFIGSGERVVSRTEGTRVLTTM
jgi:hypothetical protein